MIDINQNMTADIPSRFGMSTCVRTSIWTVRARAAAGVKGQLGFAVAYVPGPHAWSPPTC